MKKKKRGHFFYPTLSIDKMERKALHILKKSTNIKINPDEKIPTRVRIVEIVKKNFVYTIKWKNSLLQFDFSISMKIQK